MEFVIAGGGVRLIRHHSDRGPELVSGMRGRSLTMIIQLIYAELSVGFARVEDLDHSLPASIERVPALKAAFLAGLCFVQYRRVGGARRSPLPDFSIAADAATSGRALLTRDRPRHLTLLPTLEVIAPERTEEAGRDHRRWFRG